ncbi:hypothetical protein [Achromobacter ruhlandii]|uniref:hypothetical protein n=1 Tax=Achromobacter ruhlandii TaxID=72557 RepID=UPI0012F4B857|nr:hypothetical protein [Achromobacter ruhlandii]
MHNKQLTHRTQQRTLMLASALKVAKSLGLIVAVLAAAGKLIEEWETVLWNVSLGGKFWGAISVGLTSVAVFVWANLVAWGTTPSDDADRKRHNKIRAVLTFIRCTALLTLLAATVAMFTISRTLADLDIYQKIFAVAMIGAVVAVFGSLAGTLKAHSRR